MATDLLSPAANVLLWVLDELATQAPQPRVRFTPHRQYCLPVMAHVGPSHSPGFSNAHARSQPPWGEGRRQIRATDVSTRADANRPLGWGSLRSLARLQFDDRSKGRDPPKSLSCIARHHKTQRPIGPSYPEGNFEGNQLLGRSMSLSPLYTTRTSDLHVSIADQLPTQFPTTSL